MGTSAPGEREGGREERREERRERRERREGGVSESGNGVFRLEGGRPSPG